MATRWGVASCGGISNDFVSSWGGLPKGDHVLVAAAARNLSDAQDFANKYGGKKAYGSYQELATDSEIEIVYIGVVNIYHLDLVKMMLEAGKHVLCEKPLGMNLQESQEMIKLAKKKKLFLMEAIWSRFFPVYREMKRRLASADIGDVEVITVSMGLYIVTDRIRKKSLGGGVTLDLGFYCIQLTLFVMNGEMPSKIVATGHINEEGVDETVCVTLSFSSGKMANLYYSCRCDLPNEAVICGTKGKMKVFPPFWSSERLTSPSGEFVSKLPSVQGSKFNYPNSQGLCYEANGVRQHLKDGLTESPFVPFDETLKIAEIQQIILKQLGVKH